MDARATDKAAEGIPYCPNCQGQDIWRNGTNSAGTQQWRCRSCSRIFVSEPYIPNDIRLIAERMLLEEIPVPAAARILNGYVSRRWLYKLRGAMNGG